MREDKEQFFSVSGIPIKETYTPEDVKDLNYEKDIGFAGEPPFTRGVYRTMYRGRLWTLRQLSGFNTPEEANMLFKQEYELGQTGFAVAVDIPTVWGIDSDDSRAYADVGDAGVPIDSLQDIEIMFKDLPVDTVSTWFEEALGPIAAMYFAMAEKRGLDLRQLRGSTAFSVASPVLSCPTMLPIEGELRIGVDYVEWCSEHVPKWHPACADSYNFREQGINAIQELGLLLSSAIYTVETLKKRGRAPLEQTIRRFSFNMGMHNDFFEEIAKLRAGRRMWYKIARKRFGVEDPRCWQFRLHVQS